MSFGQFTFRWFSISKTGGDGKRHFRGTIKYPSHADDHGTDKLFCGYSSFAGGSICVQCYSAEVTASDAAMERAYIEKAIIRIFCGMGGPEMPLPNTTMAAL